MRHVKSLAVAGLVLGVLAWGLGATVPATEAGKVPFTVSKETTVVLGPLRADGTVDYVAALNEKYGKGVTAENNGFVVWLQVVGTGERAIFPSAKKEVLRLCGATEIQPGAEIWGGYQGYIKRVKGLSDAQSMQVGAAFDELDESQLKVWKAPEHPDLAAFLKDQERLLALTSQAAARPKWWIPAVPGDGRTAISTIPMLATYREVSEALCSRAVLRGSSGDIDGMLRDLKTVRLMARQVGSGMTLIERLVGVFLDSKTMKAAGVIAANGGLTEAQCKLVQASLDEFKPMHVTLENVDVGERWIALDEVQWLAMGRKELVNKYLDGDGWDLINRNDVDWDLVMRKINGSCDEILKVMKLERFSDFKAAGNIVEKRLEQIRSDDAKKSLEKMAGETREAYSERVGERLEATLLQGEVRSSELERRNGQEEQMVRVILAAATVKAKTGAWPKTAEELVPGVLKELPKDMYSAGGALPFKYVVKAGGVRVYSVGENGRDDGGVREGTTRDDFGVGVK